MKKFDVLIIGTGMGGLVCGNILSREGYRVCMIEKNKQLGGCLQVYARNKVVFDSGVHYLGGLDKGQNLYQIFKWLGVTDKLRLERMDPAFDRILIGGDETEYRIMQGYDAFETEMISQFPEEKQAIRIYLDTIKKVCDSFPLYRLHLEGDPKDKQEVMGFSARQFIASITSNETLRAVLAGNNMLYAGVGDQTPFYVHALTVNSYMESAWRCLNGGSQITKALAKNITDVGGSIFKNRQVQKLVVENDRAQAVMLNDGSIIYADHFVSNTSPANTYRMMDAHVVRPAVKTRIDSMENTISSFILNIVFKKGEFSYFKHNYYYQQEGSVWRMESYNEDNWPLGYAIYLTPSADKEYADGMTIFAYMRYDEVAPWATSFNTISAKGDRGAGYEIFKQRKSDQLLDRVEERFADIRKSILHVYSSTPLTFRDYIGNQDGNLYGSAKDYQHPLNTLISPKTKIPNLYLTGQYLNLHGILGTAISGLITSMALMGKNDVVEKIKHA